MLQTLHVYGDIAVVGRRGGQRLWDMAGRWYPPGEPLAAAEAGRIAHKQRFRALGVRRDRGRWLAHPDIDVGAVGDRLTVLSPFDQLVADRDRGEAPFGCRYRLEMYVPATRREYGYHVLPILAGDRWSGGSSRRFDRPTGKLEVLGRWGETGGLEPVLARLERFLAG